MRKILFITPSLCQGGVEHSLITALWHLNPNEYDITLYLYVDKLDLLNLVPEYVHVIIEFDNTKYYRLPNAALYLLLIQLNMLLGRKTAEEKYRNKLSNFIHDRRVAYPAQHGLNNKHFDVIVSYSVHIGSEMALNISSDRYILFIHSSDPYYHRDITSRVFDYYDPIVAVSDGVKRVVADAFPGISTKLTTLYNYVDSTEVVRKANEEFHNYNAFKEEGKRIICSCGRFSAEKGYDMAVKAAKKLHDRGVNFVWFFVGDGSERENIETLIRENELDEVIVITGFQANPYPYIKHCDIYVQPSYEEAQPIVLLETKILGRPIVSTNTVGGRTILEDGKAGILTEISSDSLADAITTLLDDETLRKSFENLYSESENKAERASYIEGWRKLLT